MHEIKDTSKKLLTALCPAKNGEGAVNKIFVYKLVLLQGDHCIRNDRLEGVLEIEVIFIRLM